MSLIGIICCKIVDFTNSHQILEDPTYTSKWVEFGWVTVSFEVLFCLSNVLIFLFDTVLARLNKMIKKNTYSSNIILELPEVEEYYPPE